MRKILDSERVAAERLLDHHRLAEDTDTDAEGNRVIVEFCSDCDNDWPCDTSIVAETVMEFYRSTRTQMTTEPHHRPR